LTGTGVGEIEWDRAGHDDVAVGRGRKESENGHGLFWGDGENHGDVKSV
jgi:hypothetical protein